MFQKVKNCHLNSETFTIQQQSSIPVHYRRVFVLCVLNACVHQPTCAQETSEKPKQASTVFFLHPKCGKRPSVQTEGYKKIYLSGTEASELRWQLFPKIFWSLPDQNIALI